MIDTHCHLTSAPLADDVDGVLDRAREAGLDGVITVATTSADCAAARRLAERFDDVWCTAGVHPLYADQPCDWAAVRRSADVERCVAWGELASTTTTSARRGPCRTGCWRTSSP